MKLSAHYYLLRLQQALLHQEPQDASGGYGPFPADESDIFEAARNQGDSQNDSRLQCPHVSCKGNTTKYKAKRNLERHYSTRMLLVLIYLCPNLTTDRDRRLNQREMPILPPVFPKLTTLHIPLRTMQETERPKHSIRSPAKRSQEVDEILEKICCLQTRP